MDKTSNKIPRPAYLLHGAEVWLRASNVELIGIEAKSEPEVRRHVAT